MQSLLIIAAVSRGDFHNARMLLHQKSSPLIKASRGELVRVLNTGEWYNGRIIDIIKVPNIDKYVRMLRIRILGWPPEYDEWINAESNRIMIRYPMSFCPDLPQKEKTNNKRKATECLDNRDNKKSILLDPRNAPCVNMDSEDRPPVVPYRRNWKLASAATVANKVTNFDRVVKKAVDCWSDGKPNNDNSQCHVCGTDVSKIWRDDSICNSCALYKKKPNNENRNMRLLKRGPCGSINKIANKGFWDLVKLFEKNPQTGGTKLQHLNKAYVNAVKYCNSYNSK